MQGKNDNISSTAFPGDKQQRFVVTAAFAGKRLDVYLSEVMPLSRSRIRRMIDAGAVVGLGGVALLPKHSVAAGDVILVSMPPPEPAKPVAQNIPLNIVYEDEDLIVINKPIGMVVHPGAGVHDGTLVNALLGRSDAHLSEIGGVQRPGIVHRLDKDTSGLLVVARNDRAHQTLSAALARRDVSRIYQAIVLRDMPQDSGKVDMPIGRHPTVRTKMAIVEEEHGGRSALTYWHVVEHLKAFALLECKLATGRTHQIRVHMAYLRHPVLGDDLYGGSTTVAAQLLPLNDTDLRARLTRVVTRQMLHARYLSFDHPRTGKHVSFEAPLPADFVTVLDFLRNR